MKKTVLASAILVLASNSQAMGVSAHASVSAAHASVAAHPSVAAHSVAEPAHVTATESAHVSAPAPHVPMRTITTTTHPWYLFGHAHTSTTQVQCDPKKEKDCK